MKKILLIDNFDSFTYNLAALARSAGGTDITVARNNVISLESALAFPVIILSPGPGLPEEAGIMPQVVSALTPHHSVLGVCLGHQCIGESCGATLKNLDTVVHGRATSISVTDARCPLFAGVPETFRGGRYHSWVINRTTLPHTLVVTAEDAHGEIMAVRHTTRAVYGVQFHPESVLTEHGEKIMSNFLSIAGVNSK